MQYIAYIQLGIQAIMLLLKLIADIKGEGIKDTTVDQGAELLTSIGQIAKVKELNSEDINAVLPEIKALLPGLIQSIKELHGHVTTAQAE